MIPLTDAQVRNFESFLAHHTFFIIAGHKEPDGDCLSSCLGIAALLTAKKLPYQFFSAGPFKRSEIKRWESLFPKELPAYTAGELAEAGLIIADCSEYERLGDIRIDLRAVDTFIIDHHRSSDAAGDDRIIEPQSPATAIIVQQLYERLVGTPDAATAATLFFGLATDTNYFRYLAPGDGAVFHTAARLVDSGADPRSIYDDISAGKPFATRKLLALMLERAEQKFDGRLIYTYETMDDTHQYGREGRDSDSLYQLLLSVQGVEAVLFVRQETADKCTAGIRSRSNIDVSAIAAKFGGGGHKNAAGLSTASKLRPLLNAIIDEFTAYYRLVDAR